MLQIDTWKRVLIWSVCAAGLLMALLAHFAPHHQVGVSGFSMGGNIAALVGALMDQPVAIAPLAAVLAAVALLAGYLPAVRASRIDPAMTLRQD